jgi:hypothetical protein
MTGDHHGRNAGRATLLVRAVDALLGTDSRRMGESMPDTLVDAFFQFFRRGGYDDSHVDGTAARLLGRPPRTFGDWALAHAEAFR